MNVADYLARPCPWLVSPGDQQGIVLSSRVRLARTLDGWSFHRKLSRKRQQELTTRLGAALQSALPGGTIWPIVDLSDTERAALVERQAMSRELASAKRPGALHLDQTPDRAVAAMVNEEDHLRLQVLAHGLCLPRLLDQAVAIDRTLETALTWAVHPRLGYLTACHTNVGTGLRASVMLHLPALAETGELKAVLRACARLHLAVRGLHGEGTEATGHCYQLSNARSLGQSEDQYVSTIQDAASRVIEAERLARQQLLVKARSRLEDKVYRSWGLLSGARVLTSEECQEHLSWLRLGVALDVLGSSNGWAIPTQAPPTHRWQVLDRIALQTPPATLQLIHGSGDELDSGERDELRAKLVRSWLSPTPN